jgi:RNA polymerase-binding transcription factor DksA
MSTPEPARLRAQLDRATRHVALVQAEYDEVLRDPGVIQEDRDTVALLLEQARRDLDQARAAVDRLDAGDYGRCVRCGGDIGSERLAAIVDVTTCVRCAG